MLFELTRGVLVAKKDRNASNVERPSEVLQGEILDKARGPPMSALFPRLVSLPNVLMVKLMAFGQLIFGRHVQMCVGRLASSAFNLLRHILPAVIVHVRRRQQHRLVCRKPKRWLPRCRWLLHFDMPGKLLSDRLLTSSCNQYDPVTTRMLYSEALATRICFEITAEPRIRQLPPPTPCVAVASLVRGCGNDSGTPKGYLATIGQEG
jgi:hypothetical protein